MTNEWSNRHVTDHSNRTFLPMLKMMIKLIDRVIRFSINKISIQQSEFAITKQIQSESFIVIMVL